MSDAGVVIVGGGIGGTVLAGLLARKGIAALVLEKGLKPPSLVRPELLWPRTQAVLSSLVSQDELEREAIVPLQGIEVVRHGDPLVAVTRERLERSGARPVSTDPSQTRELLLRQAGFPVRRGVEVVGVLGGSGARIEGVRVRDVTSGREEEVRARLVVADDGVTSRIRAATGVVLETKLFPMDFFCFGFPWSAELPDSVARAFVHPEELHRGILGLLLAPLPASRGAGLVIAPPALVDGPDAARAASVFESFVAKEPGVPSAVRSMRFPLDFTRVRRPWGHAERYGAPGAVFMGDAAHPVSPAGGQGANMSVADATVLAELIAAGTDDLVPRYEAVRRKANARSLAITARADALFSLPAALFPGRLLPHVLRFAGRRPALLDRSLRFLSTAFAGE